MAKRSPGGTPATVALTKAGIDFTLHPYEHHDDATGFGDEAAEALGVPKTRIFKTLVADVGGELIVAVVPVAQRLDLKALASAVGTKKAAMADPAAAARSSGYVVGGIAAIGQRAPLRTVIDQSATDFETIMVSAGKRGLQVELKPADLARVTGGKFAPIGH
jgi:Cys-tRNA(Pro)/Cys-tRNA(Cys) deacylase